MDGKWYKLEFLPLSEEDMNKIVDYIAFELGNPTAAHRLVDEVQQAIQERLTCAESFGPFPSTRHR